jgi:hypothetical protein
MPGMGGIGAGGVGSGGMGPGPGGLGVGGVGPGGSGPGSGMGGIGARSPCIVFMHLSWMIQPTPISDTLICRRFFWLQLYFWPGSDPV